MVTESPTAVLDNICVRCGYDLRGMRVEGNCPECGLGIARSMSLGQQLRDSRPGWIASLAWAARLLLASGMLLLLVPVAGPIWRLVADLSGPNWSLGLAYDLDEATRACVIVLSALTNLVGAWMLTRRENPHASVEPLRIPYLVLRICSIGPLLASLLWLVGAAAYRLRPYLYLTWDVVREIERWGNWIVCLYALCPMLQFYLLRRLATRVLNRRLLEHTNIAGIGFPAGVILMLVAVPVLSDWSWSYHVLNSMFGYLATLLVWVFIGLFWLWSMYAFGMSAQAFGRAASEARSVWEKADAALTRPV